VKRKKKHLLSLWW